MNAMRTDNSNEAHNGANDKLLDIVGLKKYFPVRQGFLLKHRGYIKAVDGISFYIRKGETMGLVGESGCGKTTAGRLILRLIEPTAGQITFDGQGVLDANTRELNDIRRTMQVIFQDPYASLNPRMKIGNLVEEPLRIHKIGTPEERRKRVRHLLNLVGLAENSIDRYPHEFSGGQRQRIGIARSLALKPKLIICDEPVSALDVSIQSQILNLLVTLQEKFDLTYLFISHDLGVVKHMSDRVGVMYLGKIMELAPKNELYNSPKHPYTKALISAIPVPDPEARQRRMVLKGDVPNPRNMPKGCRFHSRCPYARPECRTDEPMFREVSPEHFIACHFSI